MAQCQATQHNLQSRWWVLAIGSLLQADAWSPRPPTYQITGSDGAHHKSLYPSTGGPVQPLLGKQAADVIKQDAIDWTDKDQGAIWIVEYYDVGCPHCWYFSAIYPTLAKAIASPTVRIGAFNCVDDANTEVCGNANVMSYPTVIAYNAKGNGESEVIQIHKHGSIDSPLPAKEIAAGLEQLSNSRIKITHPEVFNTGAGLSHSGNLISADGPPGKTGWGNEQWGTVQTRFHDAHIGMVRLLTDGYVSKEKYQAALDVIQFVGRAFGRDESEEFSDLMSKLTAKENLEPLEFKAIMNEWAQPFNSSWIFCTSKTCGVWQLFHGISSLIAIKYAPITVAEALPKYRFMVDEFMDCQACRYHFVTSYDACLFGRCEVLDGADEEARSKALVLWLWRTHNAVSQRVISEHPPVGQAVDRRWPPYHDCPGCWNVDVVNGEPGAELTFQGQDNHDQPIYDVFNEEKVFGFILWDFLGEESGAARLFQKMPVLLHHSAAVHRTSLWAIGGVIAGITALFFVVRRFGRDTKSHRSRAFATTSTSEQELLEAPEEIE